ncbi:PQQ-binding-like beta-propeller repeat protein [Actinomadura sp. CNU-125]|uniref:PQQ-binding-like beta-propeller repeat protein n=1 Tax=Actinomadura sp. CNU-125 TaxID=1904961 RepID=UPI0021CCF12A|nr:PQQ-binding-like beta-propeller repeat protein [Actinomadura sp. CNU-125]
MDADTGDPLWQHGRETVALGLTAVGDSVYYESGGLDDGYVHALDARTGERRWLYDAGMSVREGPLVADGTVYVAGVEGSGIDDRVNYLHAVDAGSGAKKWSRAAGLFVGGIATADGIVYFSDVTEKGRARNLHALDARTGKQRWKVRLEGDVQNMTVSLTVADGAVYDVREDGFVVARDLSGRLLWKRDADLEDLDDVESPTVAGGVVYQGGNGHNAGGEAVALDARTGKELWRYETDALAAPPTVADGTVYVATKEGELHLLDARTGDSRGGLRLADGSDAGASVADGVVYFDGGDGRFRAAEITR